MDVMSRCQVEEVELEDDLGMADMEDSFDQALPLLLLKSCKDL